MDFTQPCSVISVVLTAIVVTVSKSDCECPQVGVIICDNRIVVFFLSQPICSLYEKFD